jgi:hypothetical protein
LAVKVYVYKSGKRRAVQTVQTGECGVAGRRGGKIAACKGDCSEERGGKGISAGSRAQQYEVESGTRVPLVGIYRQNEVVEIRVMSGRVM